MFQDFQDAYYERFYERARYEEADLFDRRYPLSSRELSRARDLFPPPPLVPRSRDSLPPLPPRGFSSSSLRDYDRDYSIYSRRSPSASAVATRYG